MPINHDMLHSQGPDDVAALKARIAELEAENEKLRKDKDFTEYAERTDNQISEMDTEIRRLRKENESLKRSIDSDDALYTLPLQKAPEVK